MIESLLYRKLPNQSVQCRTCSHYCLVKNHQWGRCYTRQNINGQLFFHLYGQPCSVSIDPIEKKPFFHFWPGSTALSIATLGCNFHCANCHNWSISQLASPPLHPAPTQLEPSQIIALAKAKKTPCIAYTYTEPTVFLEYALAIMELARQNNIKNVWVSNGYFSPETFNLISPYLDAINIDLKSAQEQFYQNNCGGRLGVVLDNLRLVRKNGIHLEITTLIIPTLNDNVEDLHWIAQFIKNQLGPETPWHLSSFSSAISWKLQHLPDTDPAFITKIHGDSLQLGLKFVYAGNVFNTTLDNTYCPDCGALMIERQGYIVKRFDHHGHCRQCQNDLQIIAS